MRILALILVFVAAAFVACQPASEAGDAVVRIEPGDDVQRVLQTALLTVEPGTVIELGEGRYEFDGSLSLDVAGVTLRGAGMGKTILDFSRQEAGTGGEGILVTSDDFVIENLSVLNTKGEDVILTIMI